MPEPSPTFLFTGIGLSLFSFIRDGVFTDCWFKSSLQWGFLNYVYINIIHSLTQALLANCVCVAHAVWAILYNAPEGEWMDWGWEWGDAGNKLRLIFRRDIIYGHSFYHRKRHSETFEKRRGRIGGIG